MLSKTITDSSAFLMMPLSSQALYMHLNQHADDDGYCEFFGVMRMCGANADDLKVLSARNLIQLFDDRVLILRDWKENNYIQKDRYQPSKYLSVYKMDTACIQDVHEVDTQVRLGKVRLELGITNPPTPLQGEDKRKNDVYLYWEEVIAPITSGVEIQRKASVTLLNKYGFDACQKMIRIAAHAHANQYARKEVKVQGLKALLDHWDAVVIYAKSVVSHATTHQRAFNVG